MKDLLKALEVIIRKAGKIVLSAHDIDNRDTVKEKAGDAANMVTLYDVAVQEFLISEIKAIIPDAVFIAEEQENESGRFVYTLVPAENLPDFISAVDHIGVPADEKAALPDSTDEMIGVCVVILQS